MEKDLVKSTIEMAIDRTKMAATRTIWAADTTLMAWVRTALTLISFGFTIYKVLEGLEASGVEFRMNHVPKTIGLFLTGIGTLAMLAGTVEYWSRMRELNEYQHVSIWRPSMIMGVVMSLTGVFLFTAIVTRML